MFKFIKNIGDYFSGNYFDEEFSRKVLEKCGLNADDIKKFHQRITPVKDRYYRFKKLFIEDRLRIKDKIKESHIFHTYLLKALGYEAERTNYDNLFHLTEKDAIPVRHILYRGEQPHLMILEMQAMIKEGEDDPDGLFQQRYNSEEEIGTAPQKYHRSQWADVFKVPEGVKISPVEINKAVSELFLLEPHQRPKYILLLAGNIIYLLEQEKWFRGSYLEFDLEDLFTEATANPREQYYALFYFLCGKEALSPDSNLVLLDQLDEDSHKSAYEVTKDLKEGIIHAVEALANEAIYYLKTVLQEDIDETDDRFEQEVKDDCLRIIYRLLFIFYAESREDLDILPSRDAVYSRGYSLEMLRDLEQVPLHAEKSRNGYFFHESLFQLFRLLSSGYRERESDENRSFRIRHIDSPIFDDRKLHQLHRAKFRNSVWQDIICRLSLSKQQKKKARGRISYANLGINQLGAVYESLLAYRGFYAEQDYIEVHKKGKPEEGTYLVPRSRRDDFEEEEILKDEQDKDVILSRGSFVYRLSGRDRQKSASYYTPEVLTRSTVKYTLKPILERLEKGEMKAMELLELKLLEPAMGAAAFHNEMINQLAEAYLIYRQQELKNAGRIEWKVQPDKYREELQRIKAYIATNNTYGVDLNPTAIELGKLSLWLNVIHRDMETPFFSNRICVGNAVVGAWLKVYKVSDIDEETDKSGRPLGKQPVKAWWEKAPRLLEFSPQKDYSKIKHGRKADEIYHFLLPDKNMLASAGIKMLKENCELEAKKVTNWKKEWIKPLRKAEIELLKKISTKIDELLVEYYRFQRMIQLQTSSKQELFGVPLAQMAAELHSYDEKERLADQRNRHSSPYFKLKMLMDYWCSLWFWDLRDAEALPNRTVYWNDLSFILQLDTDAAVEALIERRGQQSLFDATVQTSFAFEPEKEMDAASDFAEVVVEFTDRKNLFDDNRRLQLVTELASKYAFFHPQLEFLEVFWERGGFDLIAGNPPWLKVEFDEKIFLSEKKPELLTRKISSPLARKYKEESFIDPVFRKIFVDGIIEAQSVTTFIKGISNYILLIGQKNNLYKCILENSFTLINKNGFIGLVHPETILEDPDGAVFRKEIFNRYMYHFQFKNELMLFSEIDHHNTYSINIYKGKSENNIHFYNINNLFHPSTIDTSFSNNSVGEAGGIKELNDKTGKYVWNIKPHGDRIVEITYSVLNILNQLFEGDGDILGTKLVSIHSKKIISILNKISKSQKKVKDIDNTITPCFRETDAVDEGNLVRETRYPELRNNELIFGGPHFFVGNPIYKTPRSVCDQNSDYDVIDLSLIEDSFLPRTNYIPEIDVKEFSKKYNLTDSKNWIDSYRIICSTMLSPTGERTLQPAIIPPNVSHINAAISTYFEDAYITIELAGTLSSLVLDFFLKTIGAANLTENRIETFPLGVDQKYKPFLFSRTLLLNCLNKYYAPLWEEMWQEAYQQDNWSKDDRRLKAFSSLTQTWEWATPLRNWYERRQALVEIDVITAMALGLSLEELILIYNIQFPVLQQNEDDTWYDTKGNIVFTCSKGLVGVGVDRAVWEQIRHLQAGETYTHTITKSELYQGQQITYYAPFDKCDRVEDYKVAWNYFEGIFKEK